VQVVAEELKGQFDLSTAAGRRGYIRAVLQRFHEAWWPTLTPEQQAEHTARMEEEAKRLKARNASHRARLESVKCRERDIARRALNAPRGSDASRAAGSGLPTAALIATWHEIRTCCSSPS
jgi:hypothetical protein